MRLIMLSPPGTGKGAHASQLSQATGQEGHEARVMGAGWMVALRRQAAHDCAARGRSRRWWPCRLVQT